MCGDVVIIILLLLTIVFRVCVLHTCAYACAVPWPDLPCVEVRASIRMPSSDTFLREGLSLNLELAISARLTGQGASRICLSTFPLTSAGLIGTHCPTQCFYIGSRDINSGSCALGMSTLPTEPPPQPLCTIKASRLPFYPTQHM